ncbi:MAG: glycoside hydrolase family 13 protein [candidate division KSB1 bacterium]|nr:glycoside hydrolase family 13 protein [candidate division KSB1 bacterium]MDZ7305120.1 glycoside hydrolase family 13 protein [candidate division KSB1 bacterium]MDZ7314360.1 glycoside hydrolase family 13 protein [candidate division KSB1 bacterium]
MSQKNSFVPAWAAKAVWYQIFPERFCNGDPNNDPTIADIRGAYPHDVTSPWQIHPWTSDWYELQPYEQKNGKDIWFNLQRRRYGGDVQGILEKLDYLQELGINAIYLNPVFQAPSLHKYDGATYHHIDPNFGPDPAGDRKIIASEIGHDPGTWKWTAADKLMLRLIHELHQRGMHIIFDGVFNHVGINHWAFQDVVKNQQRSIYRDWFKILKWDDPQTEKGFEYSGWWSVKELPELRQDETGIVDGPREYIYAITRRWMDPNGDGDPGDGIDGWRLDVAALIHHNFWKQWRALVKRINPEAYLTGEVVDTIEGLQPYLQGDEFDAVMNYNFTYTCTEYFMDDHTRISTGEFDRRLRALREAFPAEVAYVMQNLLDSHDTDRLASRIVNRDKMPMRKWREYYNWSRAKNPAYEIRRPNAEERQVQKLLAIFQMTYLGAPMIYYGDEAGMWGANDPCCRKPMVWEDMNFADELYLPNGTRREQPDAVVFDREMYDHYRRLIHIRNSHPALQVGDYHTLLADDGRQLFAFSRSHQDQMITVVINNSRNHQHLDLAVRGEGRLVDLLETQQRFAITNGQIELELKAKTGRVLARVTPELR